VKGDPLEHTFVQGEPGVPKGQSRAAARRILTREAVPTHPAAARAGGPAEAPPGTTGTAGDRRPGLRSLTRLVWRRSRRRWTGSQVTCHRAVAVAVAGAVKASYSMSLKTFSIDARRSSIRTNSLRIALPPKRVMTLPVPGIDPFFSVAVNVVEAIRAGAHRRTGARPIRVGRGPIAMTIVA
jgi:hypothetical protein